MAIKEAPGFEGLLLAEIGDHLFMLWPAWLPYWTSQISPGPKATIKNIGQHQSKPPLWYKKAKQGKNYGQPKQAGLVFKHGNANSDCCDIGKKALRPI